MNSPLISIIIPTYNRAHLIGETLDSILVQTYLNWECIVVDDGSTDNTADVMRDYIKKDNRFQYHQRPDNRKKGPNSCRNYGFELSHGKYINWFDSDDLYFSDSLEIYLKCFNEDTDVVIAKVEMTDSVTKIKIGENCILSNNIIEDYFVGLITFYVCGPLWKKSFLKKQTELFDEVIMNLDDWDFNLRMLYQNPRIIYINKPLIKYRIHENSLSKEIEKLNFSELKSEFSAREKQLLLILKNKKANVFVLKTFIKDRYKYILRAALVQKNNKKTYFFKKLLVKQLIVVDIKGVFKTLFGFTLFCVFNKGYKYFK
jgi:glycosyltransferase involved in cell wall biosynthesis